MTNQEIIEWLLKGDVAIQFQVKRDLLGKDDKELQKRIEKEGWGKQFLSKRNPDGHWGQKFYQPKWTSTHYTLLDLRDICLPKDNAIAKATIDMVLEVEKGPDGGVRPIGSVQLSDVCINGMFLNYACYFKTNQEILMSLVDFILTQVMPDGGFNCRSNRSKTVHSSLHSTITVLEGISEYEKNGYDYRIKELQEAKATSIEFILQHQLYKSDKTGEIIRQEFLRLPHPGRWRYDILRALDYFRYEGVKYDERMQPALDVLMQKRIKDGRWKSNAKHTGQEHFEMEKAGQPSRWNTLRAMRVVDFFDS